MLIKKYSKPENFTLNKIGKDKARIEQSSIVYKAPYSTNILIKVYCVIITKLIRQINRFN